MEIVRRRVGYGILATALLGLTAIYASSGAADDTGGVKPEYAALDQLIFKSLREPINRGADLYNGSRDFAGCYHIYEGALITVKPMLGHRPTLQKSIDTAIENAKGKSSYVDRSWVLRDTLDQIRAETNPNKEAAPKDKGTNKDKEIKDALKKDADILKDKNIKEMKDLGIKDKSTILKDKDTILKDKDVSKDKDVNKDKDTILKDKDVSKDKDAKALNKDSTITKDKDATILKDKDLKQEDTTKDKDAKKDAAAIKDKDVILRDKDLKKDGDATKDKDSKDTASKDK